MSTHRPHPDDIRPGRLDPDCPRCKEHRLHSLDNEHLLIACGVDRDELEAICTQFPQLRDGLMNLNALSVQRELDAVMR